VGVEVIDDTALVGAGTQRLLGAGGLQAHSYLNLVVPVALADRHGPITPRIRQAMYRWDTGVSPGGAYTASIVLRPRAQTCLTVLRAAAYVVNTGAITPLAARRQIDGALYLQSGFVDEGDTIPSGAGALGALITTPFVVGETAMADRLDEIAAAAAARQLRYDGAPLYLEGAAGNAGGAAIAFHWGRVAGVGDTDTGILCVHYLASPLGTLAPYA
jgi:hypothetical protein